MSGQHSKWFEGGDWAWPSRSWLTLQQRVECRARPSGGINTSYTGICTDLELFGDGRKAQWLYIHTIRHLTYIAHSKYSKKLYKRKQRSIVVLSSLLLINLTAAAVTSIVLCLCTVTSTANRSLRGNELYFMDVTLQERRGGERRENQSFRWVLSSARVDRNWNTQCEKIPSNLLYWS